MAWIYLIIMRKGEDLLADVLYQQVVISGREVGAADALVEEHVSRDDKLPGMADQADATIGMARGFDDLQLRSPNRTISPSFSGNSGSIVSNRSKP